jgi:hypothetical protein
MHSLSERQSKSVVKSVSAAGRSQQIRYLVFLTDSKQTKLRFGKIVWQLLYLITLNPYDIRRLAE